MNPKLKYLEIKRKALMAELMRLTSKIDNPALTREQLDVVKKQVEECKQKFKDLGFAIKEPSEK